MSAPEVSIVIPVHNGAHDLGECLRLLDQQSFRDFEVIVVDDASSDNSGSVVESFRSQNPSRFRLIRLDGGDTGAARAVNAGVRAMRGAFLSWVNPWDRPLPYKIERLLHTLRQQPDAALAYSAYFQSGPDGTPAAVGTTARFHDTPVFFRLLESNFINSGTVMLRRSILDRTGPLMEQESGFPELRRMADYILWLDVALLADIAFVNEPLQSTHPPAIGRPTPAESRFAETLARYARRSFLRQHGLARISSALAGRTGLPRTEVYEKLAAILSREPLPEDVMLFGALFRCEPDDEIRAIGRGVVKAQQHDILEKACEYWASTSGPVPADVLQQLGGAGEAARATVGRLLERSKATFRDGQTIRAAAQLQDLLAVTAQFPDLDQSARYYLAVAREDHGDLDGARDLFASIVRHNPSHRKATDALARLNARAPQSASLTGAAHAW